MMKKPTSEELFECQDECLVHEEVLGPIGWSCTYRGYWELDSGLWMMDFGFSGFDKVARGPILRAVLREDGSFETIPDSIPDPEPVEDRSECPPEYPAPYRSVWKGTIKWLTPRFSAYGVEEHPSREAAIAFLWAHRDRVRAG